jgi:hypothetical protein
MKIERSGGVGPTGPASAAKGAAASGDFRLAPAGPAVAASQASPVRGLSGVGSLDALLALQDVGGPLERRRRAVYRAGRLLDLLDGVKLSLLDGELPRGALQDLVQTVAEARHGSDDPGLEGVLDEIETRAAVELAKLQRQAAA